MGEAGNGKTSQMIKLISEAAKDNNLVYVIIPEQFSFEYERKLYNELGSRISNKINVFSFTRLAKHICDIYGGKSGEYADENTKTAIMYLALNKIKENKSLMFFNRQAKTSDFITNSLELVSSLRRAGVSPQELTQKLSSFDDKTRVKAEDLAVIFSVYDSVLSQLGYKDNLNDITEAAACANMNDMFEDSYVFVDEFESFSPDELQMLEVIVAQAKELYVALCTPDTDSGEFSVFATVNSTYSKLRRIASKYSVGYREKMLTAGMRFKNEALVLLSRGVLRKRRPETEANGCVKITEARDMYDEVEYVCASIKELIRCGGYRYSQICVVSRQLEEYSMILEETMKKYEIPYFIDTQKSIMHMSLVLYITSLLTLISTRKMSSEVIFRYAKTGLACADLVETSVLENYCYAWDIDGDMWNEEFTLPGECEKAEEVRQKLVIPVIKLREQCRDACAGDICRYIYEFLLQQGAADKVSYLISQYKADGCADMASEISRLWGSIMDIFNVLVSVLGNVKLTAEEFRDIFTVMLRKNSLLNPPQKLDIVSCISAQKARLNDPAVTFVLGVNEGIMPYAQKVSGLLSDSDINGFAAVGIDISKDTRRLLTDERFTVYRVFSSAGEKLFITYPLADTMGSGRFPSFLISQIRHMFSDNIFGYTSDRDMVFYSPTPESAYYNYVQHYFDNNMMTASVREVLTELDEYAARIACLDAADPSHDHRIEDGSLLRDLIGDKLELSATSFQEYNLCHFKYYCNHALGIKPRRKKEYNTMESGNLIHMCLENILRECSTKQQLLALTPAQINEKTAKYAKIYREQQLGGDYKNSARLDAVYEKFTQDISLLVEHLQQELNQSKFFPDRFEFVLSEKNNSSMTIRTDDGIEVILKGKIDRIDKYEENGETFIRIVDYKTGAHSFSLTKVMFGIDMQLLLYLFSVTGPDGCYKDSIPAGILYMPSGRIPIERDRDECGEKDDYLNRYFHMTGMVLKELPVLEAMEEGISGVYIPARLTAEARKKGTFVLDKTRTQALTRRQIERLRNHADILMRCMAQDLYSGDISASPLITKNDADVCNYCDYWDICGNVPRIREKVIPDDANQKVQDMLGGDE